MAYWWVSQQSLYASQRQGYYLWAPKTNDAGQSFYHWRNMKRVRPGDVIFSYANRTFPAVSIARTEAYSADCPPQPDLPDWHGEGHRIDVSYRDFSPPVPLEGVLALISPMLPARQAPLYPDQTDYPGYLFELPGRVGRLLLDYLAIPMGQKGDEAITAIVPASVRDAGQRQALAASRLGLGPWRREVAKIWNDCCAVTRCRLIEILRTRHIKPWCDSTHEERLDPHNGLLLSPLYDAAFAAGLITFQESGQLIVSKSVDSHQWDLLAMRRTSWLTAIHDEHQPYLAYHREQVFLGVDIADSGVISKPFAIS
jgi:hypothetical protein